jgi:hypothetical protein
MIVWEETSEVIVNKIWSSSKSHEVFSALERKDRDEWER